jgi:hypothetical protein
MALLLLPLLSSSQSGESEKNPSKKGRDFIEPLSSL